jgi:hypothetical protein
VSALVCATATHLPWQVSCLEKSLAIAWLLARRGGACDLVLGVKAEGLPFEAHAWIELDGQPSEPMPAGDWRSIARWPIPAARPVQP